MARIRFLLLILVVLAVSVPGSASTSTQTIGCSGEIQAGGTASCVTKLQIPHFDPGDAIDYETLIARIVSPQAYSWRVHGKIADARGKVYFAWECSAGRSTVTRNSSAYFDRTCQEWRKLAKNSTDYYTARTSKPQVLTVTAWVGGCASGVNGCRFQAAATYLLHD